MNRFTSTTRRRLTPRLTVIGGAALGLLAGATVYGAVSSSAQETAPAASKAPVPAAGRLANCTAGSTLQNGVCVVHIAGKPGVPSSAATAATAKAAHLADAAHELSKAGDKKPDKDGDDARRRAGSTSERDGAGHQGVRGDDGDDRAPTSAVKTPAPVPAKAPVRASAPTVTAAQTGAPVASAAS